MLDRSGTVLVCGGTGLVGGGILRRLRKAGFANILAPPRTELDLTNARNVESYFLAKQPTYVFLAAAKVGGIYANSTFPGDFIRDNLAIQCNVIDAARRHQASKLLFLGSNCVYPRLAPQPMKEEHILSGPLEPTNQAYAVAKIAGIEMVKAYRQQYGFNAISLMPCSLYGPGDHYDPHNSHVLGALLRRFHEAKVTGSAAVAVWGSGQARREFMHVDDMAAAALFMMDNYDEGDIVNIGIGDDISIGELAHLVAKTVGFQGAVEFDLTKPDGMPRKLLDSSRAADLGWTAKISFEEGLKDAYLAFLEETQTALV
jgi:GDP-L-fucose synthase